MKKFLLLIFSIAIVQAAGLIGSVFTVTSIGSWYQYLEKPIFSPPNWVFGPVWALLYTLIGISLFLVLRAKKTKERDFALKIFWIHLVLNALWSPIFFGLKRPDIAFFFILLILAFVGVLIRKFRPINKWASRLLYPYLLWVSFATILNLSIVLLN